MNTKLIETNLLELTDYNELERIWNVLCDTKNSPLSDWNGHFWIEIDGEIYDDYPFTDIDKFRECFGINPAEKLRYERCDNVTTNMITTKLITKKLESTGYTEKTIRQLIGEIWREPKQGGCLFNCIATFEMLENKENARIVFGSLYMENRGICRHYYQGVPNAKTFYDFKKEWNNLSAVFII